MRIVSCPLIIVAALLIPTLASPQVSSESLCDSMQTKFRPIEGELGYQHRGNRCEGRYSQFLSGFDPTIVPISLTIGGFPLSFEGVSSIFIHPPKNLTGFPNPIHIIAIPKQSNIYYRMDAEIDFSDSLEWHLSDVVLPSFLAADDLGIYGTTQDNEGNRYYVPLVIGEPSGKSIALVLRVPCDVDKIIWCEYPKIEASIPEYHHISMNVLEGNTFMLELEPDSTNITIVEVTARIYDSPKHLTRLTMYIAAIGFE